MASPEDRYARLKKLSEQTKEPPPKRPTAAIPKLGLPEQQVGEEKNYEEQKIDAELDRVRYENEKLKEEIRRLTLENDEKQLSNTSTSKNILYREIYAEKIYKLSASWIAILCAVIFFSAISPVVVSEKEAETGKVVRITETAGFKLNDNVLIALIGGTTANVLGLFLVVVKYLFNSSEGNQK